MNSILFATSEAYPLMKTGGLGDVAGSLPPALKALGCDVRVIMPAYRDAVARAGRLKRLLDLRVPTMDVTVSLLETTLPGTRAKIWLVDYPPAYDRPGNPYLGPDGHPWPDNGPRFALLARVVAAMALEQSRLAWRPQIVHCNDWQTGLVPALLALEPRPPATIFTVHNLAYQGMFPYETFLALRLPHSLWSSDGLEFHGHVSFIKGGLAYADHLTTVSPTYANEIQTPAFGYGLDGLLRHRAGDLTGILNGINDRVWNPGADPHLTSHYSWRRLEAKAENKRALQRECGLPHSADTPLIGLISRLVDQKGIDLVLAAMPRLLKMPLQFAVLGNGNRDYERALTRFAARHPDRLAVRIGYDETLAHRIEGGADMFLMPSRFEPCGLNQLYSLRYGTVPIVHRVGGLADTVIDADVAQLAAGKATGITFDDETPKALLSAVGRAVALFQEPAAWKRIVVTGMRQSFSWRTSAKHYLHLYGSLVPDADTTEAV